MHPTKKEVEELLYSSEFYNRCPLESQMWNILIEYIDDLIDINSREGRLLVEVCYNGLKKLTS